MDGTLNPNMLSTRLSPIQKFRWVHFPRNAELPGSFVYRVSPVFMNALDELSYGDFQEAAIELRRDTFPGQLNVAFTRGFVSSQAFVDRYASAGAISKLLPAKASKGLTFTPTHPKTKEALRGWASRRAARSSRLLDQAIGDPTAQVRVIAYDLNEPEIVGRLEKLKARLMVIIDDSEDHGAAGSAENQAAARLAASAGADHVKRQHMLSLQHNKTIVVERHEAGPSSAAPRTSAGAASTSSRTTPWSCRAQTAVDLFLAAFESYWTREPGDFGDTPSARLVSLGLGGIDASVAFSPHAPANTLLRTIADDIGTGTSSCLFFSLAFLYQTSGPIRDAIKKVANDDALFVYGISDRKVGGLDLTKPDGNIAPVFPAALEKNVPKPFSAEPVGGGGIRMHHKFLVLDFDQPTARVYTGSYNFSSPADTENGENLLLLRDRRIATSYTVEALRIFDHYHFRVAQAEAKTARKELVLARPPRKAGERPWWRKDYTSARKIRDRLLFA